MVVNMLCQDLAFGGWMTVKLKKHLGQYSEEPNQPRASIRQRDRRICPPPLPPTPPPFV